MERTKCDICEKRRMCETGWVRENHGNLQRDNWVTVKTAICSQCKKGRQELK